jgi:ketosteroid isomerase-like protein
MAMTSSEETNRVLDNHLSSAQRGDLEGVMSDFSDDSVLFLAQGPIRGMTGLRTFYEGLLTKPPSGFPANFKLLRRDVEGEVGYIVWKAEPGVRLATDTILVRGGKIRFQTFAAYLDG